MPETGAGVSRLWHSAGGRLRVELVFGVHLERTSGRVFVTYSVTYAQDASNILYRTNYP